MLKEKFIGEINSNQVICGIYKIENLVNHKVYIGQSIDIYKRWKEHKWSAFNKKSKIYKYPLYRAIRKYGIKNFKAEIIKETYDLNYWEIFLIQIFDSMNPKHGYNVADGGYLGTKTVNSRISILCINTKQIKSYEDWSKLKYHIQFGNNKYIFYFNNIEIRKIKGLFFLKSDNLMKKDINFYFNNLDIIESEYDKWYKSTRVMGGKISVKFSEEHIANLKKSRTKQIIEKKSFVKCIESEEVYSSRDWTIMGYNDAYVVASGNTNSCHGLHFEYVSKKDYENFQNITDKSKYELKRKENEFVRKQVIYAKCIETNEIYPNSEWKKLGYSWVGSIMNTSKSCHKKHFIESTKEEYESYIKQLSNIST